MQLDFHHLNSPRVVRQATVCMVALAFFIGAVRFGTGSSYDVNQHGFKVENISNAYRSGEQLPWLKAKN